VLRPKNGSRRLFGGRKMNDCPIINPCPCTGGKCPIMTPFMPCIHSTGCMKKYIPVSDLPRRIANALGCDTTGKNKWEFLGQYFVQDAKSCEDGEPFAPQKFHDHIQIAIDFAVKSGMKQQYKDSLVRTAKDTVFATAEEKCRAILPVLCKIRP